MAGRRRPALLAGVLDDIRALPTTELRELAFRLMLEIEAASIVGKPLDHLAHVGDLSDCYKVYFDHPHGHRPGYRIVSRANLDDSVGVARTQVVAVGQRSSLSVYREAVRRLGSP